VRLSWVIMQVIIVVCVIISGIIVVIRLY